MGADTREMMQTIEAARLLNLSIHSVQNAMARGRLRGEKRAGRWFVSPAEAERYRTFHMHAQVGDLRPDARRATTSATPDRA